MASCAVRHNLTTETMKTMISICHTLYPHLAYAASIWVCTVGYKDVTFSENFVKIATSGNPSARYENIMAYHNRTVVLIYGHSCTRHNFKTFVEKDSRR